MSDYDNGGASKFSCFLVGAGFGALLALLFAPRSGQETRDLIGSKANLGREYVSNRSKDMRDQAEQIVGKAKDLVNQQKDQLSAALEAGKQAYQSEKSRTQ
jgi:gas vesicle protein